MTHFLLGRASQPFRRALLVAALALGLIGVAAAPAAASTTKRGTQPQEASIVVIGCNATGGGDVDLTLTNNRRVEAWYTISVYRNHDGLVFEGEESVLPADPIMGTDGIGVLEYRGLPPAGYLLVVKSHGRKLAAALADFRRCPALPVPPPPLSQQLSQSLVQQ
jgi:hypothetical protein